MKNKLTKILTAGVITAASFSMIGCGTPNKQVAKNIDKGVSDFVSSINNLDYIDVVANADNSIGKIVETSANNSSSISDQYLTKTLEELEIDNPINLPSTRSDNFKLYFLSDKPFITFTSSDNNATLNMQLTFSTEKIEETSLEINSKINNLILKRSILMIYVNEIYNNRVNLTEENRIAINAYVNVIKENASFLNGNRGMVKNQLTLANDLIDNKSNDNLVNYYMIKSGEALENRSSKIDSTISAMDSIIKIIENNLSTSSVYYNLNLSSTYDDILSNITSNNSSNISTSENKELGDNISNSLNFSSLATNNLNKTQNTINETQRSLTNNSINSNRAINKINNFSNSTTNNKSSNSSNSTSNNNTTSNNLNQNQSRLIQNNEFINENKQSANTNINNLNQRKSANLNHFNENINQKQLNNYKNNNYTPTPRTLELQKHNNNSLIHNDKKIEDYNNLQNRQSNNIEQQNHLRANNINNRNHSANENIKRVPYIKTFD